MKRISQDHVILERNYQNITDLRLDDPDQSDSEPPLHQKFELEVFE